MHKFRGLVIVAVLAVLPGCSSIQSLWADRYGPDPVVGGRPVGGVNAIEAPERQGRVVLGFLQASGYKVESNPNLPQTSSEWYSVILTGFNAVDDACQAYIDDLWRIEREKNRVKDIISASGAATAAIVGSNAHPSAATLTQLAQAFGLASALTTAVGDSYLFAQNPASVGQIVKKLQVAYRDDRSKNIDNKVYPINSPAAVYYHTREYLSLCLPPTIQAQIESLVAKAKAGTDIQPIAPTTKKTSSLTKPGKAATSVALSSPPN